MEKEFVFEPLSDCGISKAEEDTLKKSFGKGKK